MTPEQKAINLEKIAKGAVSLERAMAVPAELCAAQCILESGWLQYAKGNNAFGIKAGKNQPFTEFLTREVWTDKELAYYEKQGVRIQSKKRREDGLWNVMCYLKFRAFATIEDSFLAYGELLLEGKNFKDRFKRYLEHKNVDQLLRDMQGEDGKPKYAKDTEYVGQVRRIMNQQNVQQAIQKVRKSE